MQTLIRLGSGRLFKLLAVGAMRFKGAAIAIFVVAALIFLSNWKLFLTLGVIIAAAVIAYGVTRDYLDTRRKTQEVETNWNGKYAVYDLAMKTADRWPDLARVIGLASAPLEKKLGYLEALEAVDRSQEARLRRLRQEPDVLIPELISVRPDGIGYRLDVKMLEGQTVEEYIKASEPLAEATGSLEVRPMKEKRGEVSILFVTNDPLETALDSFEWPAVFDKKNTPIALNEYGKSVNWPFSHTLIVGATGSGKGSVLWALIRSLLPGRDAGLVEFYGIDPKFAEFAGLDSGLFEELAFDADDIHDMLVRLVNEMNERRDGSRKFEASGERPYVILMIDEILSIRDGADKKQAAEIDAALLYLLSKGRSLGMYVIGAIQRGDKAAVGAIRDYFGIRIGLRLSNATETNMVLGEGATDEGARNHLITPATEANDHKTAGLGWMRTDDGMTRLRFPFTNDDYIEHVMTEYETEPVVEDEDEWIVIDGELIEEEENDG